MEKAIGAQAGVAFADAARYRDHQPLRQVHELAGKAVDVESKDAGDVFAEIVTPLLAGPTNAAGEGAVHHHRLSRLEAGNTFSDRGNLTGGFGPHHQRQLALRKCHAAVAPYIDVIEGDGPDADLHFAHARWRRCRHIGNHELAIGNKSERTHDAVSPAKRRISDRVHIAV